MIREYAGHFISYGKIPLLHLVAHIEHQRPCENHRTRVKSVLQDFRTVLVISHSHVTRLIPEPRYLMGL